MQNKVTNYLVEVRIGQEKRTLKHIISDVQMRFHLGGKCPRVPHFTLFGPFQMKQGFSVRHLMRIVSQAARKYDYLPYNIEGYQEKRTVKGHNVVVFKVLPSEELKNLRHELSKRLSEISSRKQSFDDLGFEDFWFHITIANRVSPLTASRIVDYLNGGSQLSRFIGRILSKPEKKPFYYHSNAIRITVLDGNSRILFEYDMPQKRILNRRGALSRYEWVRSNQALKYLAN